MVNLSKKVVIFDVESVLIDAEFLPILAEHVGKSELAREITLQGIRGEIDWEEGLRQRLEALKGISRKVATEVADSMPYMKGAREVCRELKQRGCTLIGVTGGFSIFADRVKMELGLDYLFSNKLVFNDDKLVGTEPLKVRNNCVDGLDELLKSIGAEKDDTVAVIDGVNNIKLLNCANLKIAFNAQPIVRKLANAVVEEKDLMKILEHIPTVC